MEQTFKAVVLHGFSNEEALALMRAAKALKLSGPSPAFAMTTPITVEWKVGDLLEHLAEEHGAMMSRTQKGQ